MHVCVTPIISKANAILNVTRKIIKNHLQTVCHQFMWIRNLFEHIKRDVLEPKIRRHKTHTCVHKGAFLQDPFTTLVLSPIQLTRASRGSYQGHLRYYIRRNQWHKEGRWRTRNMQTCKIPIQISCLMRTFYVMKRENNTFIFIGLQTFHNKGKPWCLDIRKKIGPTLKKLNILPYIIKTHSKIFERNSYQNISATITDLI